MHFTDNAQANYTVRVHDISEDSPYLRQQFSSNRSVTSAFSLKAALLMGDVFQATRHLYQIQMKYFKNK